MVKSDKSPLRRELWFCFDCGCEREHEGEEEEWGSLIMRESGCLEGSQNRRVWNFEASKL
ncbi:hypothetical protein CICLE_v10013300mg [Citrus x clementina]|uniref:Uncharacterized protein n=1 Tax=Citrus clementina TaxID=85681 RepID=V4SR42_CITCL|nr:hypothetical protein CICLE_v10013300mg [Citrus x clementina]